MGVNLSGADQSILLQIRSLHHQSVCQEGSLNLIQWSRHWSRRFIYTNTNIQWQPRICGLVQDNHHYRDETHQSTGLCWAGERPPWWTLYPSHCRKHQLCRYLHQGNKTASHFCLLRDSFMMDQRTFDAAYFFSFSLFGLAGMGGVHLYFVRPVSQVQTIVVSQ